MTIFYKFTATSNARFFKISGVIASGVPRNFFRGGGGGYDRNFFMVGVQQIQLRTASRENGDLGAVAS
jgi:hypothetical protein